jgi:ferredoxin
MAAINWLLFILSESLIIVFFISSIHEKEKRAAVLALIFFAANSCLWSVFILFAHVNWVSAINLAMIIAAGAMILISSVRYFPRRKEHDLSTVTQYDERDIMFARNRLQFHPDLASRYYAAHPEKRETDEKIHRKKEPGQPGHLYYDPYRSPVFDASFTYLHRTRGASQGNAAAEKKNVDSKTISQVIDETARFYGAVDVGITPVKPYHYYSHYGRHPENWGEEIHTAHSFAVVIVVAMQVDRIKKAPSLPVILESSRQYVEAAKIAHIIAEYIRGFGYDARSHTDGNYETLCVPLAVDAGLGVPGRLGIFMHPVYGPCVRLSIVTTEMELVPTVARTRMKSMEAFCDICKKCADNCPTQSICRGEEPESRGFRHWSIDQEKCFSFWKSIGTDCGFCIGVCPYTKPDTLIHKLVRFYISRNPVNQRIALFLDDLFYGRKKVPGPPKTSV